MATAKEPNRRALKDVMTRDVETLAPTAAVLQAAEKMKSLDVGAIPVCDGTRLQGMITDRDIVLRIVAEKRNPETVNVQEAMTPDVLYCYDDQPIEDAARLMEQKQVRRVPVVNRQKQLVGIVSLGDVAVKAAMPEMAGKTLEGVSGPARPQRS
jgi:CBS domain-containing protein